MIGLMRLDCCFPPMPSLFRFGAHVPAPKPRPVHSPHLLPPPPSSRLLASPPPLLPGLALPCLCLHALTRSMADQSQLPPVAMRSGLVAFNPVEQQLPPAVIQEEGDTSHAVFETTGLEVALQRSQQMSFSSGLRRAVSAPHSLDSLAHFENKPSEYLQPTGGPMRRVQSSLGMRRSASFFWSPSAHYDFERAIATLRSRGLGDNITAAAILPRKMFCTSQTKMPPL